MSDPKAVQRLADILDDLVMELAELDAEAADFRDQTRERTVKIRTRIAQVSRMAGLPEPTETRVVRSVRRAA